MFVIVNKVYTVHGNKLNIEKLNEIRIGSVNIAKRLSNQFTNWGKVIEKWWFQLSYQQDGSKEECDWESARWFQRGMWLRNKFNLGTQNGEEFYLEVTEIS